MGVGSFKDVKIVAASSSRCGDQLRRSVFNCAVAVNDEMLL